MRKGFVKVLCVILTLLILSVFAAGCGAEKSDTPAAATKAESTAAAETKAAPAPDKPAAPAEKVKLVHTQWGTAGEGDTVTKVVKKYNESQDKIEVSVMSIPWENYMTKLNTMAAAGESPDSGLMHEDAVLQWAKQGMLADISDMYEGTDSKPMENLAFKFQGKTVAYSAANEILVLYYNKDMFDKAGVAYPPATLDKAWTWDEFVATAKKLTLDKNGKHPDENGFDAQNIKQYGCLVENLPWQLETWAISNGGGFYNKDGTKMTINEPASIEAIQKVADLYLKDHVAPLSTGASDDGVQRSIINRTCAMTTNGTWNVGTSLNAAKDDKENPLHYGIGVLPYMKNKVTLATGGPNVVYAASRYLPEAKEWIKWYAQEENAWDLFSSGIWMPILEKWYTDDALLHKWIDNPNFPPFADYKATVVDTAMNKDVVRQASWYNVENTPDVIPLINSCLGEVWTGKTTAQEAITKNIDALNAALAGKK